MSPENPPLRVENLAIEADGKTILDISELTIGEPGLHMLIGPNGSGKTTLLLAVAGVKKPSRGLVRVYGLEPRRAKHLIAYLPATPQVDPLARVRDVIQAGLYGATAGEEEARERMREALEALGITSLEHRRFKTLSSGEQRLACLARALARKPKLLLLDEPLAFLDVSNQDKLLRILHEIIAKWKTTILMATHELHYIGTATTITLLSHGKPAYHGKPENLKKEQLEKTYNIRFKEITIGETRIFLAESFTQKHPHQ